MASNRRAIRLLAAGSLVSSFGDGAAITALAYIVYQRTHSATLLSVVYLVSFGITGLLTPLAGWLADRVDRRRLLIACNLVAAGVFVVLAFVDRPATMIALMFVVSVACSPMWPAFAASVPNLVEETDLSWANSLSSVSHSIGRTAGPVAGGLLLAVISARGVFLLDAATFVVLAGCTVLAVGRYSRTGEGEESGSGSVWAGFGHIVRHRPLVFIVAAWTLMWLAVDVAWVADAPLADELGVGSVGFGLLTSVFGLGAVLGGLAARWLDVRREPVALLSGTFGVTVGFAMVGITPWFAIVLAGNAVAAFVDSYGAVAGDNLLQRSTPDGIRGRVFGAIVSAGLVMNIPAFALGGVLVGVVGPRSVYLIGGLIAAAAGFVMIPGLRSLGELEGAGQTPPEGQAPLAV